MSDSLSIDFRGEAVMARLHGTQERLATNIRRAVMRLAIEVQAAVKAEKLSGQVLHVRTGTLRRSINYRIEEAQASTMATVGTNVEYAAIHEYGFNGTVSVSEHARRSALGNAYTVGAHTRRVSLAPRSFLGSTLRDKADKIQTTLRQAAIEAVGVSK